MKIKYNVKGKERKRLAECIGKIIGEKPVYKFVPTYAYEIGYYTVDAEGTLIFDDMCDSEEVENIIEGIAAEGFDFEKTVDVLPKEGNFDFTVRMPKEFFEDGDIEKLEKIISSKEELLQKAFSGKEIKIEEKQNSYCFPWFETEKPGDGEAYMHFISALCEMAKRQKRVNLKSRKEENEKYAFRCFLLRLGFIGEEFKEERKVLLRNLSGSSAFKNGKKKEAASDAACQ